MKFLENRCVCGATEAHFAFPVADWNFSNVTETAEMLRCLSCKSLFPDRFPSDEAIAIAYQEYYTVKTKRSILAKGMRLILRMLQDEASDRHLPATASSVLDYGCGSGEWLIELGERFPGLALHGTDMARPARERLPFKWIHSATIDQEQRKFDLITLCHVLEHLRDPRETLQRLSRCLAPGGSIWIATPNAESYLFESLGGRARDADFPRHRQIFSAPALSNLLSDCGLTSEFKLSPRVNTVLNLASGIAARNREPTDVAPNANIGGPIVSTLKHLLQNGRARMQRAPELIVVGRQRTA